jgi:CheY-like chemotaxis protein
VEAPGEAGFGSTLVRNLAEGDLGADTEMDFARAGMVVRFKIPLARLQEAANAEIAWRSNGAADPGKPLAGRRILIAEDSPIIALDLSSLLEAAGAEIIGPFGTLADAAAAIGGERIDVALMNIELRGESALPLAQAAAAHGAAILFATAGDDGAAARRGFPRALVIRKPFSEAEILDALARAGGSNS